MELYQLKSFLAVARLQNLTRAAEELCLSQSALSSQLKALEEELGVALFRRAPKGMEPTDPGRILLTHAREVLDAAEGLRAKARSFAPAARASVTIGLNADPTFLKVSAISQSLRARHPDANVIFLTSQTVKTGQMLRQGAIDVGFFYGEAREEDIRSTVVARVGIRTVIPAKLLPPGAAPGWREVAALPWIWVGSECPFYDVMGEMLRSRGLAPNRAVAAADEQVVKELVAAGQGVAMIREDEAQPLLRENRVALWEEGSLTIPLSLGWLARRDGEPHLREAVEAVKAQWE